MGHPLKLSPTKRWLIASALVVSLGAVALSATTRSDGNKTADPPGATTVSGTDSTPGRRSAGAGVPTKICGTKKLDGPSRRPAGAKVVRPTQDLPSLVDASRPGTTFWLKPGVHTFGNNQYDQVGPKDGQTFIGAPGAVIDGRGVNRYAFGGDVDDVTISHLTIQDFGRGIDDNNGEGVVNHDAGDGWYIHHNTIQRNAGAGVFLGNDGRVVRNCLRKNGEYGFQSFEFDGAHDVVLRRNEIARNNTADWESIQPGCGCSGGGKFWNTRNATVVGNYVHHNYGAGLWADTNDVGFLFEDNYFSDNEGEAIFYEISYNAVIRNNTFARNGWKLGRQAGDDFPLPAIYLSEAGSDVRAGRRFGQHLRVTGNKFVDNWSGIMAWENPDRFSGSPFNSSSGFTTLVNPLATVDNCGNPDLIGTEPYFDDCRWKTQHLRVLDNQFVFRPSRIPGCTVDRGCGFMGLVANVGTVPSWSPYKGYVVPDNISKHQDNVWRDNSYDGPWRFMIHQLGSGRVSWSEWRAAPWHQDAGSLRR